jgi:type I restriction enzyme S subunit
MKISIVKYKNIDLTDRVDAEYYEPSYMLIESNLIKSDAKYLKNYCKLTSSAFYPPATQLYNIGELPFIRCVDCIDYPIITHQQDATFENIPKIFADENKTIKILKNGDIIITKVGTPCYASIIEGIDKVALSRTVLGMYKIRNINPYYLIIFLRSKYGFLQLQRQRELTIQYQLTLDRVKKVLIYKPKYEKFETIIAEIFIKSQTKRRLANQLYQEAKINLLKELNFDSWKPFHEMSFIKNKSLALACNRLDAEYYQPKYDKIIDTIKNYYKGFTLLSTEVNITKSVEPGSDKYQESGIPFIRVSNLSKYGFKHNNQQYISNETYLSLIKHQPKKNEILLSKDATPGIAYYLKSMPDKMIPSGGIVRLSLKNTNDFYPECLTLLINSMIVQQQIERDTGGSVLEHWRVEQIENTLIPIISRSVQNKIKELLELSFEHRESSEELFNMAKKAVEIAIEQEEILAIQWLLYEIKQIENKSSL